MPESFERLTLDKEPYDLPNVTVEIVPANNPSKGTLKSEKLIIKDASGSLIGEAILNISQPPKRESSAYLNTITILEDLRGQGYGKAAYLEIIKMLGGVKLKSGFQLSRGSLKVWEWLESQGLARKVNEGRVLEDTENAGYSSAEYETI